MNSWYTDTLWNISVNEVGGTLGISRLIVLIFIGVLILLLLILIVTKKKVFK